MPFNQTPTNKSECDGFMSTPQVVPALYALMFPVSVLLNSVATWVSLHLESTTTFVVYLKNLIAANVVMTLIMPLTAANNLPHGSVTLFRFYCHMEPVFYSTHYTCICLLGLISLDRFFKIMVPQKQQFFCNLTFSKLMSASIWVMLMGITALPNIILGINPIDSLPQVRTCFSLKGFLGVKFQRAAVVYLNILFWIISVVISVCYVCITKKVIQSFRNSGSSNKQGKQRIKLQVFLVVIVFFVSFGPLHINSLVIYFDNSADTGCYSSWNKFVIDISLWIASSNVCMNPLLYIFLCRKFKDKLASMLKTTPFSGVSAGEAVTK